MLMKNTRMNSPKYIFDFEIFAKANYITKLAATYDGSPEILEKLRVEVKPRVEAMGLGFAKLVDENVISFSTASFFFHMVMTNVFDKCAACANFINPQFGHYYVKFCRFKMDQIEKEEAQHAIRCEAAESM